MDVKPPDDVLFICKLNPHTQDEDLELIFSRFGDIKSCEVIRDYKTGDRYMLPIYAAINICRMLIVYFVHGCSLNYAFIEFVERSSAEEAYFKMNNVLIDDRYV